MLRERTAPIMSEKPYASIGIIFKKVWKNGLAVLLVFFVTLALFPGTTGMIQSANPNLKDWFGIIMIVCTLHCYVNDDISLCSSCLILWGEHFRVGFHYSTNELFGNSLCYEICLTNIGYRSCYASFSSHYSRYV